MDVLLMGQVLLGCLLLIALLVNGLLLRLGRRLRHTLSEALSALHALLLWAPVGLLAMVVGATALAEFNLLTLRDAQDTSGVSWFMLGACLVIFANVCSAFLLIRLRETLPMESGWSGNVHSVGKPGRSSAEKQAEE